LNEIRLCKNRCIFCFIDQLPKGLRKTLYIKDDDYLLSFIHGNFITLTNVTEGDLSDIIKTKIGPLYVSVHSMDPVVRETIFRDKKHYKSLRNLKKLDEAGIKTNIQIVLIPKINDGDDLKKTLTILLRDYINIESIGIVPVGVTRYNKNKRLKPFERDQAKMIIELIEKLKRAVGGRASNKVFLSDEFYLISDISLPPFEDYGDFYQINNGIGKSAYFMHDVIVSLEKQKACLDVIDTSKKILLITSEYGIKIIKQVIKKIKSSICKNYVIPYEEISLDSLEVKNNFLGGNVKATGLLSGADVSNAFSRINNNKYISIIIPNSIFNNEGLTLDGYTRNDIGSLGENVKIIPESGKDLVSTIYKNMENSRKDLD